MKHRRTFFVLLAIALVICVAVIYTAIRINHISLSQVERIVISNWHQGLPYEWTDEEIEYVVNLYNTAVYGGFADGSGGTPNYEVFIYFRDGSYMRISEFNGIKADYEVRIFDSSGVFATPTYYIKSDKLRTFFDTLYLQERE